MWHSTFRWAECRRTVALRYYYWLHCAMMGKKSEEVRNRRVKRHAKMESEIIAKLESREGSWV